MDKRKLTRRAAIGTAIGGMATAPFIIRALKGKYEIDMPDGASASGGRRIPVTYAGTQTTIEIPPVPLTKKELEALIREQIKNDPKLQEVRAMRSEKWKERAYELRMARLDEREKEQLKMVADSALGEEEKKTLVEQVKKSTLASRESAQKLIDATTDR